MHIVIFIIINGDVLIEIILLKIFFVIIISCTYKKALRFFEGLSKIYLDKVQPIRWNSIIHIQFRVMIFFPKSFIYIISFC